MHIRNLLLTTIGLAGLCSLPATDLQAGGLSRGAMLSASCEGCHGTNGNSPGTIPSISGRSAEYIMQALNGFHSGEREATVMGRHVRGYTKEELQLIAEHFARQQKETG
jgi:sulfide dehydrogenase cytochrome subunit